MKYSERMRNLRQDNDLSQREVAKLLGVAQTSYSQYELEKRPLPIEYVIALCEFYHVSADYFLGLHPQSPVNCFIKIIENVFHKTMK